MDLAGDSSGAGVTTAGFVLAPVLAVETGFFAGVRTGAASLVLAPVSTGAAATPVSTGAAGLVLAPVSTGAGVIKSPSHPIPPMYPPM